MNHPVTISGYQGMNNVQNGLMAGGDDGTIVASPKIILNADVTPAGKLLKRGGYSLLASLPNAHSIWGVRGVLLAAAEGKLYRFLPDGTVTELCAISGPQNEKLFYAAVDGLIYISTRYWTGVLNPEDNTVADWGIPIPSTAPIANVVSGTGSLGAGVCRICYTNIVDGQVGGNGLITEVVISENNSSIDLFGRPPGTAVWATDPDGSMFYLAAITGNRINGLEMIEPLSSFLCYPPPPMRFIHGAFGRVWGATENRLIYSEPYRYDLFKDTNEFVFPEEIQLVSFTPGGIYVGFDDRTVFLAGTEPSAMQEVHAGCGVTKGLLAYCNNVPDLGNSVPVWMSKEGLVAGSIGGQILKLTKDRVQFPEGTEGAAVSRMVNGQDQLLASFKQVKPPSGSGVGFGDSATCEVVRNGRVL